MKECEICKKEFATRASLRRHAKEKHGEEFLQKVIEQQLCCPHCGKKFEDFKVLGAHTTHCDGNPKRDEIIEKIGNAFRGKSLTKEHRKKIQRGMKRAVKKYPESYSFENISGRICHEYKVDSYGNEVKLLSGWEVEVAQYLDENEIKWTNKIDGFPYEWSGSVHQYFPDFYLPELNEYIEVKGYQWNKNRDEKKWLTFPEKLRILKAKEIKMIRKGKYVLGH